MILRNFLALIVLSTIGIKNVMALELLSPVIEHGKAIPKAFTCDGQNVSPPLAWRDIPAKTKSFVLIMDDPDAPVGVWDHWVIYNLPANVTSLEQNLRSLPQGASFGKNSWNQLGYGGPCPPDQEHRYFFKLYALDITLPTNGAQFTKKDVEAAIKGHVLGSAELMAKYQRSK